MFRLDDRTDEESQGIEERLHRGVSSETKGVECLPDPRATLQTSLTRINYFVERNGRDAAEGGIVHLAYIRFLHPDQHKGEKFYTTIRGRKCRG